MVAKSRGILAADRVHFPDNKMLWLREFWGGHGKVRCGARPVHTNDEKQAELNVKDQLGFNPFPDDDKL